jgi:aspartyl-tRNA(Asn)/glutamyl-tRNA(Gln) amidotransferase subunit A
MYLDLSIPELAKLLKEKKISSVDLVHEAYQQIETLDSELHGFITVRDKAEVLKEAERSDRERSENSSIIHGIPFSMKDGYVTAGVQTTAASKVLDKFVPPHSATIYKKLTDQGAILMGKNNMDAWGHGGSTENTDYQVGHNPWDTSRIPGGSSGGSGISVATRQVAFSIGEDTGGSIRNPASMCNTCGLKVTYGRVSRYGAICYGSSLDTICPMGKTVEDLAYLLELMAGADPKDATSSHQPVEKYSEYLNKSISGKVIGVPKEFFGEGIDPEVKQIVQIATKEFEKLGAKVVEVSIPFIKHGVSIYYLIALSETSSNLARYDGIRYGNGRENFTPETMRRIMIGTFALSAGYADELYKNAQKARTVLIEEYQKVFESCDALIAPVTPSPPAKIGELINDPLKNLLEDMYTGTINVVGVPSLAIPAGFTQSKLPIGMQLIGKKFHEGELLQLGHAYQQVTSWHKEKPPSLGNR